MKSRVLMTLLLLLVTAGLHAADETSGGLSPDIPRGKGEQCVADTDFMRRNHMDLLDHQRDETVIAGLRGDPFSLKDCIDCHAVMGPDATALSAEDPKHFCRACHDYAAVSIDCFQCHASRPEANAYPGDQDSVAPASTRGGQ